MDQKSTSLPLRVAYIVNQYPYTSHTFIRREIQILEKMNTQVTRFSIRDTWGKFVEEVDREEYHKTIRIITTKGDSFLRFCYALLLQCLQTPFQMMRCLGLMYSWKQHAEAGILKHCIYLAEACVISQECRRRKIQHLHAHFGTNPTTVALFASILTGIPMSFTVHGPEEFDKPYALCLRDKIHYAAFVVAISHYGQAQLWRQTPYSQWSKIHIVRCSVDDSFLENTTSDSQQASPLLSSIPTFVCVGRLCEQKGQAILLQALNTLIKQNIQCRVVFLGDGELRTELESLTQVLQLNSFVHFAGFANSTTIRSTIRGSVAMILPSFAEGLPVVIMESLALEIPVISTFVAGIPELVTEECGWLVPAGDQESLAEAMKQALALPMEQKAAMGRVGKQRVKNMHHIHHNGQLLRTLFAQVHKSE